MKIVIVEDEKITAKDLARTIRSITPNAEIIEMLHSVEDAILFFENAPHIDLIFSDIQLGDGLSFEIYEKVVVKAPIIYCTAFNQYALNAFKTLGIDYIVKPFSRQNIEQALEKYRTMKDVLQTPAETHQPLLELLKKQLKPTKPHSILLQKGDKIIPLQIDKIALFFIENETVYAYTFRGEKKSVTQKLNELEQNHSPNFFRVNRQFLVNRKAVKDASHYFNRKMMIHLTIPFEEQILVGKVKVSAFLNWLANT